jgi:hypothetical protein
MNRNFTRMAATPAGPATSAASAPTSCAGGR